MRIVIIGAGVLGASTAFHLARAGMQVTVVDAGLDGQATAAGAGIICPWLSWVEDPDFYQLHEAGGDYYPDLVAALAEAGETDLGYRRTGAMLVSSDDRELAWLERMARVRQVPAMGKVTRLSPAQARAMFPPLAPGLSGVHVMGGGRVDGQRLETALLRAAGTCGASIRRGNATLDVMAGRMAGVAVAGVDGDSERLVADRVIVTAGAWADQVLRPLGLGVAVEPQRGQIVHLRLEGTETEDWPVIMPPGSHYIVPFDGGRIVAGTTWETGSGFDYRVTASGQAEVLSEALRVAPGLETATMLETRVGFRPVADTGRPSLGWVDGIEGLAVGNGLGAEGLTTGPFAGRLLADLVTGQAALMDLAPFAPTRRPEVAAAVHAVDRPPDGRTAGLLR